MENVYELATQMGFTEKEVAAYLKQLAYRKEYSARPKVKAARKQYSKRKYETMKAIGQALKGM